MVMGDPPYYLDIEGLSDGANGDTSQTSLRGRPWVGIRFDCCGVYARVYRNSDGSIYRGVCPRCLCRIALRVGPGGTDARFFVAE